MSLRLQISGRAERDVEAIYSWLSERSRPGAARWYEQYLFAVQELMETGPNCPLAPEAVAEGPSVRQRLFKTKRGHPYRLLFVIEADVIHVLAVRGAGQDWWQPDGDES
jgi:plasmid stabilization system protein ParE